MPTLLRKRVEYRARTGLILRELAPLHVSVAIRSRHRGGWGYVEDPQTERIRMYCVGVAADNRAIEYVSTGAAMRTTG